MPNNGKHKDPVIFKANRQADDICNNEEQSFGSNEDVLVDARQERGLVVVFLVVTRRQISFGRARSEFHKKSAELGAITA